MHTLGLTHDRRVYSWGVNDEYALGGGTESPELPEDVPGLIKVFPKGTVITSVAAGDSVSVALASTKHVYVWGTFRVGP